MTTKSGTKDIESTKDNSVRIVFNSGWSDPNQRLYETFFNNMDFKSQLSVTVSDILETKYASISGSNIKAGSITVGIEVFQLNNQKVGLWYPTSNYCNFDVC